MFSLAQTSSGMVRLDYVVLVALAAIAIVGLRRLYTSRAAYHNAMARHELARASRELLDIQEVTVPATATAVSVGRTASLEASGVVDLQERRSLRQAPSASHPSLGARARTTTPPIDIPLKYLGINVDRRVALIELVPLDLSDEVYRLGVHLDGGHVGEMYVERCGERAVANGLPAGVMFQFSKSWPKPNWRGEVPAPPLCPSPELALEPLVGGPVWVQRLEFDRPTPKAG